MAPGCFGEHPFKEVGYERRLVHDAAHRPNVDRLLSSDPVLKERNRHIRSIEKVGRREWQRKSRYTKRSMVENAIYRYKAIIGADMRSRSLACRRVETRIGWKILNTMTDLGTPQSYRAG